METTNSNSNVFSIHKAVQNRQLSLVRALVEEDAKVVDIPDVDGRTALHWASTIGAPDIAAYLIDHKAEVDKTDSSGWTALHIAASAGQESIVRELLAAGADVNKRNDKGLTPLHYAASKSQITIGKLLIERGADINARDGANQLALHRAATTGSTGFVGLLLKPPVPVVPRLNTADRAGNTALHLAMESGHAEVACRLIEAGADRDRANQEQLTAEELEGVGGQEQQRVRDYVIERCGVAT